MTTSAPLAKFSLPEVPYRPRDPRSRDAGIGLIGCGAITRHHLQAYRDAGYRVAAMSDVSLAAAEARRDEFYPDALATTDHRRLLELDAVQIVDVATHPEIRGPLIADALRAGKHVLSQKPFVLDLDEGERLAQLAEECRRLLAVNQNGRWAPHFSWMREAVRAGLIGQVTAVHCGVHWDHSWVKGTKFQEVDHLILYDFAIHWFDFLTTLLGPSRPLRVYASRAASPTQDVAPPLMGQTLLEFPHAQATLAFDGHTPHGRWEEAYIAGSESSIRSFGVDSNHQTVELAHGDAVWRPTLAGRWFNDGFHGTMGELMCAIEEGRAPSHSARNNLASLEVCFAAVASAQRHEPVVPGTVRRLPEANLGPRE